VKLLGEGSSSFKFFARPGEEPKLYSIFVLFPEAQFSKLAPAYLEKFGKPQTDETKEVRNQVGAVFENRTLEWVKPTGTITLIQRVNHVDQSIVHYFDPVVNDQIMKNSRRWLSP
jgi:hypothetical protein